MARSPSVPAPSADYIRAFIIAAALDEIGFPAEATQCRKIADQAVQSVTSPSLLLGRCEVARARVGPQVRIAWKTLKRVAPIVVRALNPHSAQVLGGVSTIEIVTGHPRARPSATWHRHADVRQWQLPTDKATYVTHRWPSTMATGVCASPACILAMLLRWLSLAAST